jgi:hypothetical protein
MADREEKSIVEKISDAVKGVVDTASAAAMKAMQAGPDPGQVAGTTNEQVYIPGATDAAAMPAPLIRPKLAAKKKPTLPAKLAVAKTPPKKVAVKTASKKAARKTAKKSSRKPTKKTKSKAVGKTARKVARKKKAKKSKR